MFDEIQNDGIQSQGIQTIDEVDEHQRESEHENTLDMNELGGYDDTETPGGPEDGEWEQYGEEIDGDEADEEYDKVLDFTANDEGDAF